MTEIPRRSRRMHADPILASQGGSGEPREMTDERPAVETLHFVLCPSFHGATLLAVLLNNHPDIVTLGDTNPTRAYDQICACERLVSECPFWQEVARECQTARFADGAKMLPTLPRISKHQKLNKGINLALGMAGARIGPGVWSVARKPAREFVDTWNTFRSVAKKRGRARLAIDGESRPNRNSSLAVSHNRSHMAKRRFTQLLWHPNN